MLALKLTKQNMFPHFSKIMHFLQIRVRLAESKPNSKDFVILINLESCTENPVEIVELNCLQYLTYTYNISDRKCHYCRSFSCWLNTVNSPFKLVCSAILFYLCIKCFCSSAPVLYCYVCEDCPENSLR
jgi:hypothetical protein